MKTEIKTKAERCVGIGAYETGMQGPEDKLKRIPVQVLREIGTTLPFTEKEITRG